MGSKEALTSLVVGYEIATRAGIALHATAHDYHTSGAWNALGVAAMGARIGCLDRNVTREALGIAEYHGPRSQMMRCIDHPTMVNDDSGWGALAGMSAVDLAVAGFTGAPAILIEGEREQAYWGDLGTRWHIEEQYFKAYPVCRWAQPAIEAMVWLKQRHAFAVSDLSEVRIFTFAEAVRLGTGMPATTEQAQYALGFPVAALLARGAVGSDEISDGGLNAPDIRQALSCVRAVEDLEISTRFPAERLARIHLRLTDGTEISSPVLPARGDPESPLPDSDLIAKFRNVSQTLGQFQNVLEGAIWGMELVESAFWHIADIVLEPLKCQRL